ncbi:hypothetical protein B0H14DRAFT_3447967 [Mycena olivaceomarginata]|nr:hypothetical protein B0H14DRAFT_3447967 [Mycena olivaceomarginata]
MSTTLSGSFSFKGDSPTSLMLMITHCGVGNGNKGFNYIPTFATYNFEAGLQSSNFLRAMLPPQPPVNTADHWRDPLARLKHVWLWTVFTVHACERVRKPLHLFHASLPMRTASSLWALTSSAGLTEGDFDIKCIPELGCVAFPTAQPSFPGSKFLLFDGLYEVEMGEFDKQALGGELDLHFGDLGMRELDKMLTDGF